MGCLLYLCWVLRGCCAFFCRVCVFFLIFWMIGSGVMCICVKLSFVGRVLMCVSCFVVCLRVCVRWFWLVVILFLSVL